MTRTDNEDAVLRSVAPQDPDSILLARQRAEEEFLRTREALRESEERLKAALSAAGTGTFRWDLHTNTVHWEGNLDRLFGLETDRATQSLDAFIGAVHPDDRPAVVVGCERCAREGADFDMEFRVVWPDGSVHWIDDKARTFRDAEGNPIYVAGACADITTRKAAAEALRASEERLRAIFDQTGVEIWVADLSGRFVEMNRKFSDVLGYSADELRQITLTAITHPDDLAATETAVRQLLEGAIPAYSLREALRPKGSVHRLGPGERHVAERCCRPAAAIHRRHRRHHAAQAYRGRVAGGDSHPRTAERDRQGAGLTARFAGHDPGRHRCRHGAQWRPVRRFLLQPDRGSRGHIPSLHGLGCTARGVRALRRSELGRPARRNLPR